MKRALTAVVVAIAAGASGACSAGYDVTPTSDQTDTSVPKCFVIHRYDDGKKDGLAGGTLGTYCKADQ